MMHSTLCCPNTMNTMPARLSWLRTVTACLLAAALLSGCGPRISGAIEISIRNPHAAATPPGVPVAAAYMEILSGETDALMGASTPIAERVEIHESRQQNGTATMRPVPKVELRAGNRIALEPGGLHFMLLGLKEPLVAGTQFPFTLHFERAGGIQIEVVVTAPGAGGDHDHSHH